MIKESKKKCWKSQSKNLNNRKLDSVGWRNERKEERWKERLRRRTKTNLISFNRRKERGGNERKVSFLHNVSSLKCPRTKDLLSQVCVSVCVVCMLCVCGVLSERRRISMRTGSSGRLSGPRRASSRLLLPLIATATRSRAMGRGGEVATTRGKRTIATAANN